MSQHLQVSPEGLDDEAFVAACASLGLMGRSPAFRAVLGMLPRLAACDAPVVLRGATGTGKELFARASHYLSPRRGRPFVPVNCGGLTETVLDSELFGHVRGAFTDARADRQGLMAMAERGTLLLDEVDSLTPKGQVVLLRFLQDREYRQVGGEKLRTADVRVLAASNRDLATRVAAGGFRQDLLFPTCLRRRQPAAPDDHHQMKCYTKSLKSRTGEGSTTVSALRQSPLVGTFSS